MPLTESHVFLFPTASSLTKRNEAPAVNGLVDPNEIEDFDVILHT